MFTSASYKIAGLFIILLIFSCKNSVPISKVGADTIDPTDTLPANTEEKGNPIDYDNTSVIKTVYVTDRNGAERKGKPNQLSESLGTYEYGAPLEIIEITDTWLGVRDRVTRAFVRNGSNIESTRWEKLYVRKSSTGELSEIKLIEKDLKVVSSLTVDEETKEFHTGQRLTKYITLELIEKGLFLSKKSTAISLILEDTTAIKKIKGVIELPVLKGIKRYIDKPEAEEGREEYTYLGQIEFLNKYLVSGSYWESWDYKLIDKTTGLESQSLGDYPICSPDKKFIICISANPYSTTGDLELYSIKDKQVTAVMSASFKNWMPVESEDRGFWSNDGYLYIPAQHVNAYWNSSGNLNTDSQYVRIKVL